LGLKIAGNPPKRGISGPGFAKTSKTAAEAKRDFSVSYETWANTQGKIRIFDFFLGDRGFSCPFFCPKNPVFGPKIDFWA
jgi:hypothetical protein